MTSPAARIGIDLGGTKTEGIILSARGDELHRIRRPTVRGYDGTLADIVALVGELESAVSMRATIGIGIPGAVSADTGLVKNANSTWLIGHPLHADLERVLGRSVRLMNDANCFAISEATDGAARGAGSVFGVIIGTGVGGGIVMDGRLVAGANLIAGEWGHNPLPWPNPDELPGPKCYCGRHGCIETFVSGPGFERDFAAATGRTLSATDIVAAAHDDNDARDALARYVDRLARGLASVINVVDPDVIVLGGGMSNVPSLAERVSDALPRLVFSGTVRTRVVRNLHGDSSGVRGAAWLWPAPYLTSSARTTDDPS